MEDLHEFSLFCATFKCGQMMTSHVDINAPLEQCGCTGASRQHFRCQWASMQFTAWFQRCGRPAFQNISQTFCTRGRTCSDRLLGLVSAITPLTGVTGRAFLEKCKYNLLKFLDWVSVCASFLKRKLLVWFRFRRINTDRKSKRLPGTYSMRNRADVQLRWCLAEPLQQHRS